MLFQATVRACSVAQSCPTLCDPLDCGPPGSSAHGIQQARMLEWVAMASSRGSSWPRDGTCASYVSCIGRCVLYHWRPLGLCYICDNPSWILIQGARLHPAQKTRGCHLRHLQRPNLTGSADTPLHPRGPSCVCGRCSHSEPAQAELIFRGSLPAAAHVYARLARKQRSLVCSEF